MPKSNHTPGPWGRHFASTERIDIVTVNKDGEPSGRVACIHRVAWCNDDEESANARLIAAAPVQHDALLAIVARINGEWDCPALVAFGPLSTDTQADCLAIARTALTLATTK